MKRLAILLVSSGLAVVGGLGLSNAEAYPVPLPPTTTTTIPATTTTQPSTTTTAPIPPEVIDNSGARMSVDVRFGSGQNYSTSSRTALCSGLGLSPRTRVLCVLLLDSGPQSQSQQRTGQGVAPMSALVSAFATTDASGSFSVLLTLPAEVSPGSYVVESAGTSKNGQPFVARAVFVVGAGGVVESVVDGPPIGGRPQLPVTGSESSRTTDLALVASLSGAGLILLTSALRRRLRPSR